VQQYLDKVFGADKVKFTKPPNQETIDFYDTPGCDFLKNHLILRRRAGKKKNDVTLKCRTDSLLLADVVGYLTGNGNKDLSSLGLGNDVGGEVDLTFWFRQGHPKLLIAELSYKLKSIPPSSLREKAEALFDTIRSKSKEDLSLETSKTAIAYGNSCKLKGDQ